MRINISAENFAEFRRKNSFVRPFVRSFVRSAEISAENLNCLLDLYDDSCEPRFFTYVFTDAKICAKMVRKSALIRLISNLAPCRPIRNEYSVQLYTFRTSQLTLAVNLIHVQNEMTNVDDN